MSIILKDKHKDQKLDHDVKKSGDRIKELKAGRSNGDIPLNDEYWLALAYHQRTINPITK